MKYDGIGPHESIARFDRSSSKMEKSALDENDKQELADFFRNQIREFEDERRRHEARWDHSIKAFENRTEVEADDFSLWTDAVGDAVLSGLPYAATMTNVAALTPPAAHFGVKPRRERARRFATVCQAILHAAWNTDERQRLVEKLIMCCRHTGLMIGMGVYETDYDEWREKLNDKMNQELNRDDAQAEYDRTIEAIVEQTLRDMQTSMEPSATRRLRGESDHTLKWEEPGIVMVKPHDYVADPTVDDLVNCPRWEGRKIRMRLKDLQENPRYDQAVVAQINPARNKVDALGGTEGRFRRRRGRGRFERFTTPNDHQMVDIYEIYKYDHTAWKDQGGALITISLDVDLPLEVRANPYGRRAFCIEAWNDDYFTPFPQGDFDAWKEVWASMQDIYYRMIRQLRKASNGTLIIDENSAVNRDALEGVIENDDGGVSWLDLGEKNIQQVMMELKQMQVSPEYINAMNFMMQLIRVMEGLGPNQFGGSALKSETSASEAQEIGGFARARLDVKGNAIRRWLNKAAGLYLSMIFRFMEPSDIADLVGDAVSIEDITMATNSAPMIDEVRVSIHAGAVHPEGPQQIMNNLKVLYELTAIDPLLKKRLNRDALRDMINAISAPPTGLKMILDDDDLQALNNGLELMIESAQMASQGSAPAMSGQSNAPGPGGGGAA